MVNHPYLSNPERRGPPLTQTLNTMNSDQLASIYPPQSMDQAEMAQLSSTGPQENVTIPQLARFANGWQGMGQHFRVLDNVIKIKNTDAVPEHVPSVEQRMGMVDEHGNFSQYEQVTPDKVLFHRWMNKIGPYLADWVLHKSPNGAFFFPCFLAL